MIFWVDAQLPPQMAHWLKHDFGAEAFAVRDLGLRDATDLKIFETACRADVVLISKDADFVELIERKGPPPRLLWVTCGNVSNDYLRGLFNLTFKNAVGFIESGAPIVEIGSA